MTSNATWELVMGVEVHCQLSTKKKLFCDCRNEDQAPPNTHICPVCLGYPGVLPKLNWEAVAYATKAAYALNCRVNSMSEFSRKHYFYPDLPKGYQITQFRYPHAEHGRVPVGAPADKGFERHVVVRRVHIEEDAAKNIHHDEGSSVNYNRGGVPLIEIVSDPFCGEPWVTTQYLKHLHWILLDAGVTRGNLEDGHLRCDVNISVRPKGSSELRTRVEVKNLNSFRFIEKAIAFERDRQIALYESGGAPEQETRLFDAATQQTHVMRSKEEAMDYRYFPEPDLPVVELSQAWIERHRFESRVIDIKWNLMRQGGADENQAAVLMYDPPLRALYDETVRLGATAAKARDWVLTTVIEHRRGDKLPVTAAQLKELIRLVDAGTIHLLAAKEVFEIIAHTDRAPRDVVAEQNMEINTDVGALTGVVDQLISAHPAEWRRFLDGENKLMGFFMGEAMKMTRGKIDPKAASKIFMDRKKEQTS